MVVPTKPGTRGAVLEVPPDEDEERGFQFPAASPYFSKAEVLEIVTVTYPALWSWMRDGNLLSRLNSVPAERDVASGG